MKYKKVLLRILIFAFLFTLGQSGIVHSKPNPANGINREYYPNGKLHIETRFKNGLILRKRTFYKNGRKLVDYKYKDGLPIVMRNYYENGRLKSIWTKESGVTKFYHKSGELRVVVPSPSAEEDKKYKSSYIFSGS